MTDIQYHHFHGVGTLAVRPWEGDPATCDIAVSLIHPHDRLNRKLGRDIAGGRLRKLRNQECVNLADDEVPMRIVRIVINQLRSDLLRPSVAREVLRDLTMREWVIKGEALGL